MVKKTKPKRAYTRRKVLTTTGTKTQIYAEGPVLGDSDIAALYTPLQDALAEAHDQAAFGKGRERHANGKPFDRQPIMEVGRIVGPSFNTGQAMKKLGEATQMFQRGEIDKAIHEIQGAIVYCASAVNLMKETKSTT